MPTFLHIPSIGLRLHQIRAANRRFQKRLSTTIAQKPEGLFLYAKVIMGQVESLPWNSPCRHGTRARENEKTTDCVEKDLPLLHLYMALLGPWLCHDTLGTEREPPFDEILVYPLTATLE